MADLRQSPDVPLEHANEVEHRRKLAMRANQGLPMDGSRQMAYPLRLKNYIVADLPDATLWDYALVFVTNEAGGATVAFSDGTNWRRVTDRAIVS